MRRSLSQLICADLSELAHLNSDTVASEESIRFIVEMYNISGALINVNFVRKNQFYFFVKNKINMEKEGHYQFVIEVGSRSKAGQRLPDTIHYCAVDLYIRPDEKPIAFVADHYRGYDGYYAEFKTIAEELGVHFVVAGGSIYQADDVHCPIFTLKHLTLTAFDNRILPLLDSIIDKNNLYTEFNWHNLSPEYQVFSQSVMTLFKYVDKVKANEKSPPEIDSKLLLESQFSSQLSNSLYVIKSADAKDNNKIRNRAIKLIAAKLAGEAVLELEKADTKYSEDLLVDICYKEQYPLLHKVLKEALHISEPYLFDDLKTNAHPIFELAFYHAAVLESCLAQPKFKQILNAPVVLTLMQKDLIDPFELFQYLTEKLRDISINNAACSNICSNLEALQIITNNLDSHPKLNKSVLFQLMVSTKIKPFFKDSILVDLFSKGLISMEIIDKIMPYKIEKKTFTNLASDADRIRYLENKFSIEILDSDDLFSIPKAVVGTPNKSDSNKPKLNVGLLIQSMASSGIIANDEPEKDKKSSDAMVKNPTTTH